MNTINAILTAMGDLCLVLSPAIGLVALVVLLVLAIWASAAFFGACLEASSDRTSEIADDWDREAEDARFETLPPGADACSDASLSAPSAPGGNSQPDNSKP